MRRVLAAEQEEACGSEGRAGPVLGREALQRSLTVAEWAVLALGAGELDWGREQNRPDRGESGGPRSDREHGPGTIGRLPVQEVVVDLHHDLVAGSKRDAVAVRKPAPA